MFSEYVWNVHQCRPYAGTIKINLNFTRLNMSELFSDHSEIKLELNKISGKAPSV